jgi:hypothetical protein
VENVLETMETSRITTFEFFKLLKNLRILCLSTGCRCFEIYGSAFECEIFTCPEFKEFQVSISNFLAEYKNPKAESVECLAPGIATILDNFNKHMNGRMNNVEEK